MIPVLRVFVLFDVHGEVVFDESHVFELSSESSKTPLNKDDVISNEQSAKSSFVHTFTSFSLRFESHALLKRRWLVQVQAQLQRSQREAVQ